VTRSTNYQAGPATASYTTQSGTATAGKDFTQVTGVLSWAADDTNPKTITVPINSLGGAGKHFAVKLTAAGGDAALNTQISTAVSFANGAPATPQGDVYFSAPVYLIGSQGGLAVLTVNRGGDPSEAAVVAYATGSYSAAASTDFTSSSGQLNWAAGDASPHTIAVPINSASLGGRDFFVTLSQQSGGTLGSPGTATVAILPVSNALQIHVQGDQLVDALGNTVQLRGATIDGLEATGCSWTASHAVATGATEPDWSKLVAWKLNAVRLPISRSCWANPAYQTLLTTAAADAAAAGLAVIIDEDEPITGGFTSTSAEPIPSLADVLAFWNSVALTFAGQPAVLFELGPSLATGPNYVGGAYNLLIHAIRSTNATNVILLGGPTGDSNLTWWTQYPPTDVVNQLALAYRELPSSSNAAPPNTAAAGVLNAPGVPVVVTETGAPAGSGAGTNYLTQMLALADQDNWGVIASEWNPADSESVVFDSLIQSLSNYAPTQGEGVVYNQWSFNHRNTAVNVGPIPNADAQLPATTPTTPIQAVATGSAGSTVPSSAALTRLLVNLSNLTGSSRRLLIGQHTNYWDADPTDNITGLQQQTGQLPAIVGTAYNVGGSPEDGIALSNQYLEQGALVMLSWWPGNPTSGVSTTDATNVAINFTAVITPGTAEYQNWHASLDAFAAAAATLTGPVYFRPFLELNGDWFWWGGHDPAQFITLWKQTHDYLVNTKGLTNLVWVYCINSGVKHYADYFPGTDYADVVAMDEYPPGNASEDVAMYQAMLSLNEPMIFAEAGDANANVGLPAPFTKDNSQMITTIKTYFPAVVAALIWSQSASLDMQMGASTIMNDPSNIVLATLSTVSP
jgi:mannan endo-1,4-beta-mannosidase